jgi:hypothetical protein
MLFTARVATCCPNRTEEETYSIPSLTLQIFHKHNNMLSLTSLVGQNFLLHIIHSNQELNLYFHRHDDDDDDDGW